MSDDSVSHPTLGSGGSSRIDTGATIFEEQADGGRCIVGVFRLLRGE